MAFDLNTLVLDENSGQNGVWVDFYGGSRLKIASSDSRRYRGALAKEARKNRIELDDSNPENYETLNKLTCKVLAENVLLDWEGIDFNNMTNVPYSHEVGMQALLASPPLRNFVNEKAADIDLFRATVTEKVKKS